MAVSIGFDIYAKDRASKTFRSVGDSAKHSEGAMSSFGSTLKKVAGAFVAFEGAKVAVGAITDMAKAAIDDQQSSMLMAKGLQNSAHATKQQIAATEDWITKQGQAYGVADDDLRPALTRLATATHSVSKAQKLASLAMDISAGTGKSLKTVTEALMKAQNGSIGGLSRLGVKTKDAAGKTMSLHDITKSLAKTYGGDAATKAGTFAGKVDRLKLAFSEAKESVGYALLPMLSKLMTFITSKGIPAIQKLAGWLHDELGPPLHRLGVFIETTVVPALKRFAAYVMDTVVPAVEKLAKKMNKSLQPIIAALIPLIKQIAAKLHDWWPTIKKVIEFVGRMTGKLLELQAGIDGKVIPVLIRIVGGLISFVQHIVDAVQAVARFASSVKDKFNTVVDFVTGLPARIASAASGMWNGIKDSFRSALNWIIGAWNNLSFTIPGVNTHIPGVGTVGGFTLSTPNIPYLARGGDIAAAGAVIVGDAGPEILQLPQGARVTPLAQVGGDHFEIHLHSTGSTEADARRIVQVIRNYKQQQGNRPLGIA